MNRLSLTKLFLEASGMHSLVVDSLNGNYSDASPIGVNYFLNAGARFLDGRIDRPKQFEWYKKDIAVGQVLAVIDNVRAIKEVWIMNVDGRNLLEKKSYGWIRDQYSDSAAATTNEQPLYWTPAVIGLNPDQQGLTSVSYTSEFTYDADDLSFGQHYNKRGILWMPPSDGIYTISVLAQFFSKVLSSDSDENYWSVKYPETLLEAAMFMLERFFRNSEGMRDHLAAINSDIPGISFDLYEEEISGATQLSG